MRTDCASRWINASPEIVFEAFLDPRAIVQWLPPAGARASLDRFDPTAGGVFQMTLTFAGPSETKRKTSKDSDTIEGSFDTLIYPKRIEQTFRFVSDDPRFAGAMQMTWSFTRKGKGTRVSVSATNVPEGIKPEEHQEGMNSSLANLAAYLAAKQA